MGVIKKEPIYGYKNDEFHGKGKFTDKMGKTIEGNFRNGKLIK